jgi:hypothetical protein
MYHPVKTMQDFTKSLSGLWLNPFTKKKFYFSADQANLSKGAIDVLQYGAEEKVSLHFNLSVSGEKIFMTVEGEPYNVSLHDIPANSLYIKLSAERTLRLLKHQKVSKSFCNCS